MPSRRDVLRFGLGGLVASALPARGDDPKRSSTLFVFVREMVVGNQTIRDSVLAVDPEGDSWRVVCHDGHPFARVSPDGRRIAYGKSEPAGVWVADLEGDAEPRKIVDRPGRPFWSGDGKTLILSARGKGSWKVSADGSKSEKLPLADEDLILDCSNDGRWWLVDSLRHKADKVSLGPLQDVYAVHPDGSGEQLLTRSTEEVACWQHRFAADGRSVMYFRAAETKDDDTCTFRKIGVDGKDDREFLAEGVDEAAFLACPSPEGKKVALVMFDRTKGEDGRKNQAIRNCTIKIADAEGKNGRVLSVPVSSLIWPLNWLENS